MNDPRDREDFVPATSEPGELYTFEGQIAAGGAFWRNLKHRNPRGRRHRRQMARTGLWFALAAVAVFVAAILLDAVR